jgi:hypothetical protein
MLQMKWIKSSIYSPWSSGKVEIFNKTVKRLLAKEVQDGNRNWHEILPRITLFYNATCHTTTGTSPFKLKHGTKVVLPWAVSMDHRPEARTQGEWTRELGDNMVKLSRWVYEVTRQQQELQQRSYNKRLCGRPLEVGDLVRVYYQGKPLEGLSAKLMSRWKGPYIVLERLSDKTYVVQLPHYGKLVPKVVHIQNLFKVGRLEQENEPIDLEGILPEDVPYVTRSGRTVKPPERL